MSNQFYLTKRNAQKSIPSFPSTKCLTSGKHKFLSDPYKQVSLHKALYEANLSDNEIKEIDNKIEKYKKSNPKIDVDKKMYKLMSFAKTKKGDESLRNSNDETQKMTKGIRKDLQDLKKDLNSNDHATKEKLKKEIKNREAIQTKVDELFPTPKETKIHKQIIHKKFNDPIEGYNTILQELNLNFPHNIFGQARNALFSKLKNPTVQQFETFYAKITDPENPIKTMEAFNEALKCFDKK